MNIITLFWLAPLLPLGVFVLLVCGLQRFGRLAAGLAVAALAVATALAFWSLFAVTQGTRATVTLPWLAVGGRALDLALGLDPLSALMAALVASIGLVVFIYALRYMAGDPGYGRFFAEMSLFIGAMLTLVLAADLITLFIAWEIVGLCSYLLIGFWRERPAVPEAATKAFATTRLADLAFLFGVVLLIGAVGNSRISALLAAATTGAISATTLTVIAVLLIVGAAGKSAQFPFQGWLPDAMAGPTPVSALLHSATMVAAGVYLIARFLPLFLAVPATLPLIAGIGAITALLGATAALAQTDLKRLLAYSTMSQIGLMFVGLGSGSLVAGIGLLVAQGVYKSTLFLAAGAVDHAVAGTGFARMGGLARKMPATFAAFLIAAAALAGLPVTLAWPAKDPLLAAAAPTPVIFVVAVVASFFTALYSTRALDLVFLGQPSTPAQTAHEAPRGMLVPILVLAGGILVILMANSPLLGAPLSHLLGGATPDNGRVTALALGIAVFGIALGLVARRTWPTRVLWPGVQLVAPVLASEYGLRPLYQGLARLLMLLARGLGVIDRRVFDAFAGGAACALLALVRLASRIDLRVIDAGFDATGTALLAWGQRLRRFQTGMVGNYLLAIGLWGLGVIVAAVIALALR